jgi:hypothetical protein
MLDLSKAELACLRKNELALITFLRDAVTTPAHLTIGISTLFTSFVPIPAG